VSAIIRQVKRPRFKPTLCKQPVGRDTQLEVWEMTGVVVVQGAISSGTTRGFPGGNFLWELDRGIVQGIVWGNIEDLVNRHTLTQRHAHTHKDSF